MEKIFEITNIQYDTDGQKVELPKSLIVVVPDDVEGADEIAEYLSDEISNRTGFCHKGFNTIPEIQ